MSGRSFRRTWPGALGKARQALAWSVLFMGASAAGASGPAERVAEARLQAGQDPVQAAAALRRLGDAAVGDLALRLAANEAECRVLTDIDGNRALAVADAGLAAAGPKPPTAARTAWLRLRACRASLLLDFGRQADGQRELDAVLSLQPAEISPSARGIALLERGTHRSRTGDLLHAQEDLLAACELLKDDPQGIDGDLCRFQLASHYRRVGDIDEAQRLLLALHEKAGKAGAVFDDSVYIYSLAQVYDLQRRWTDALEYFRESGAINEQFRDSMGLAYAEHGMSRALLHLDRPAEALPHIERALQLSGPESDPRQYLGRRITQADILNALGRPAEARDALERVRLDVQAREDRQLRSEWLQAWAVTMKGLGRWQEAYEALNETRAIDAGLHEQQRSEQAARLRMQFNRARDAEELATLRVSNEQGERLRNTQAVALALFLVLLLGVLVITVRKVRQARRLHALASTDELTGLANRRALTTFLREEVARAHASGQQLSVLMIDVDHFKRINDGHGHPVGDAVLRHLAELLGTGLREGDRLGRVGGEEFIVVLPAAGLGPAGAIGERMRQTVAETPLPMEQGSSLGFTVSIGVASLRRGEIADELVARADGALYRAKEAGRNRLVADGSDAEDAAGESPPA